MKDQDLNAIIKENAILKAELSAIKNAKSINQLQDLIDNTSDLIMLLSPGGRFLFVNKAWREVMGYSPEEIISLNIKDLLRVDHAEQTIERLRKIGIGQVFQTFETVFKNKEGRSVYLSGSVNGRFEGETLNGFRCILHNRTDQHRANRAQNLYYKIAQLNLSEISIHDFLYQVHIELKRAIRANNFFVALYEPTKGYLSFPYYVDDHFPEKIRFTRRKLGNGLTEYAIVKNASMILTEAEINDLAAKKQIYLYGKVPAIMLCVPLRVNNRTIGIIGVQSYSDANKFSTYDLEVLEFISGQVAMSLARKQAEAEMQRQTARLNAVFNSSSHVIWTMNRRFQLSSFNKNYSDIIEKRLGSPPQINVSSEKMGWRLIAAEDQPALQAKYNAAFKGQPQYFEMHWGELNGGKNWYEFYINPIVSSSNQIEEVSGIARDITSKKQAELALVQSEGKFRNIVESFLDIFYQTDVNGFVTMISPSIFDHTGYKPVELMGHKLGDFFIDQVNDPRNIKSLLRTGSISNYEVSIRTKDGNIKQYMLNIRLIRTAEDAIIEGVARDITDLKAASVELLKAKDEAEHSLKVRERFLANMSHEIRTPMNGITGMIDLLSHTPLNHEQDDYVQTIKKSSETLLTILNDILDLSKIEAGKMEIKQGPIDVLEMMNRLVALFKQRAFEKNNDLSFNIDPKTPKYILSDQTRLLQILSNLTSNALKFTENGSVHIHLSVKSTKKDSVLLYAEVTDSGIGISEEDQKILFTAFQQLDNSTKKSFGGTGLGLAISREIALMMGGDMGVRSENGQGATFWFTVQVLKTTQAVGRQIAVEQEIPLLGFLQDLNIKILVVDDNPVNRKVASEILLKAGASVVTADSGKKAIESVESQSFDLILMDIQMPEMDGIETTAELRKRFETLPKIVAMTAYSMEQDRERFLEQGLDDYIPKPIRANVLLGKIRSFFTDQKPSTKKLKAEKTASSQPLIDLEIFDQLAEMVGREMLISVYDDFEKEATEQIENVEAAYPNQVKVIQSELHTLKGNSGTIGLMRLHEIVEKIEVPAKTGNLEHFIENWKILKAEFQAFKGWFAKLRTNR